MNSFIIYKTNQQGENMEKKLKQVFPNAKAEEESDVCSGMYSIVNGDLKVRFADMQAESKCLLFSIVLAVSDIPETVAFYENFGLQ